MELSFSELRAKEVINMQDGRRLGKVCDIIFCYPDNRWIGIVVPNGRGFGKKNDLYIDLRSIAKIGQDVILVNIGAHRNPADKRGFADSPPRGAGNMRGGVNGESIYNIDRNYDEFE